MADFFCSAFGYGDMGNMACSVTSLHCLLKGLIAMPTIFSAIFQVF
jgi:hypothetical protein